MHLLVQCYRICHRNASRLNHLGRWVCSTEQHGWPFGGTIWQVSVHQTGHEILIHNYFITSHALLRHHMDEQQRAMTSQPAIHIPTNYPHYHLSDYCLHGLFSTSFRLPHLLVDYCLLFYAFWTTASTLLGLTPVLPVTRLIASSQSWKSFVWPPPSQTPLLDACLFYCSYHALSSSLRVT